jgi:hypothetical protein
MKERCDLMRRALPPGARSSRAASAVPIFPAYADDVYGLQMGSYRTLPRTRVDGSEGGDRHLPRASANAGIDQRGNTAAAPPHARTKTSACCDWKQSTDLRGGAGFCASASKQF